MIKNFVYLFALVAIIGCSNDDDTSKEKETNVELLIGKWQITEKTVNGTKVTLSSCESLDTDEYLENGDLIKLYSEPDQQSISGCKQFEDNSGSWEKIKDSEYRVTSDDGDINEVRTIVFSMENNIHTASFSYTYQDFNGNDQVENYIIKYTRVK